MQRQWFVSLTTLLRHARLLLALVLLISTLWCVPSVQAQEPARPPVSASAAFANAASDFSVPVELLKAICYLEGRLSNHTGFPSADNGFGCMHLVKNGHSDTLDQAARELHVKVEQLQLDLATNIRGGAILLHNDALHLAPDHHMPT